MEKYGKLFIVKHDQSLKDSRGNDYYSTEEGGLILGS
jgi:hypothetical protein